MNAWIVLVSVLVKACMHASSEYLVALIHYLQTLLGVVQVNSVTTIVFDNTSFTLLLVRSNTGFTFGALHTL